MQIILDHILNRMLRCILIISVLAVLIITTNKIMTQLTVTNEDANFGYSERKIFTRELYVKGHDKTHPELCPDSGDGINLVIIVHSAIDHADRRFNIRLTWGHFAQRRDVVVAFILGATSNHKARAAFKTEDDIYGDLIRGRCIDSYGNLTLKSISMLEWFDAYCPRAGNLLKTDDDMFINVFELVRFVEARKSDKRRIYGFINSYEVPNRRAGDKHYTNYIQHPNMFYPSYAAGAAYLMTRDIVRPLLDQTLNFPYLRSEDVYLTGVVADNLKIDREHLEEFRPFFEKPKSPCQVRDVFSIHNVTNIDRIRYWDDCFNTKFECIPKNYDRTMQRNVLFSMNGKMRPGTEKVRVSFRQHFLIELNQIRKYVLNKTLDTVFKLSKKVFS